MITGLSKEMIVGIFAKALFEGRVDQGIAVEFLSKQGFLKQYQENDIDKKEITTPVVLPSDHFKFDETKNGWTLIFDGGAVPPWDALSKFELVPFHKEGEGYIDGDLIIQRANGTAANLGQIHGEYLLDHQELIPEEFRKYTLVFPNTVWTDLRHGRTTSAARAVFCLYWSSHRWVESWGWLGGNFFGNNYRLLRLR